MSDILRQVDEDLRKDRLLAIWNSYRVYIVGFIIIILISLSGYQYYLASSKSKNEAIVEAYINAISSTDNNISLNQLIKLDQSSNSYIKGLSKLKRVELYFALENNEEALQLLESISIDDTLDQVIRDLALYKYLMVQLDILDADQYFAIIDEQILRDSKFKYLFKELKAIKYLIQGNKTNSLEMFDSIILDESAPSDLKIRAEKFKKISKK